MGVEARVDVIDLIINALSEHERRFDDLVSRLEKSMEKPTSAHAPVGAHVEQARPMVSAVLLRWQEFREKSLGSDIAAFDIEEKRFRVSAVKEGVLYSYQEEMPDMGIRFGEKEEWDVVKDAEVGEVSGPSAFTGKLRCGLEVFARGSESKQPDGVVDYRVVYDVNPDEARVRIARELKIHKRNVIQGKLLAYDNHRARHTRT